MITGTTGKSNNSYEGDARKGQVFGNGFYVLNKRKKRGAIMGCTPHGVAFENKGK